MCIKIYFISYSEHELLKNAIVKKYYKEPQIFALLLHTFCAQFQISSDGLNRHV